jgi:hypothetical protein
MLTTHLRSQFVTKILTNASGEQFRVVFLVALINGEVKAQVISAEPISESKAAAPLCLPCIKNDENFVTFTKPGKGTSSPSLFNELFFFNSQPTRAPSM